jgi:hypothetical protein
MDVKQAVELAKKTFLEIFAEDHPVNLGLEEIEFDESSGTWQITLGFSRPWDKSNPLASAIASINPPRSYKIVKISDESGKLMSIKNREIAT